MSASELSDLRNFVDDYEDETEDRACENCGQPYTQPYEPIECDGLGGCGALGCSRCIRTWDDVFGDLCRACEPRPHRKKSVPSDEVGGQG